MSASRRFPPAAGRPAPARPLRVLFVNSSVSGGGAGKSLVTMVAHLDRRQIDPTVLLPAAGTIGAPLASQGVDTVHEPLLPERFGRTTLSGVPGWIRNPVTERLINVSLFPRLGRRIAAVVEQRGLDAIHANHVILNLPCVLAGRLTDRPVILHMRDILSPPERWYFARLARREPRVRKLICVSRAVAAQYLDTGKTEVIYNTVDLDRFDPARVTRRLRAEYGVPPDHQLVGFFGRLVRWKGVDLLLEAFARTRQAHPGLAMKLAVVGDNDPSLRSDLRGELQAMARSLGIEQNCLFCGFQRDVRPYVADFDVCVLPSLRPEPFGRTVVEAMALGVPVIGAAHGGAAELIEDGVNGLRFPPRDAGALAAALGRVLTDQDLGRRLRDNARPHVARHFDAVEGGRRFTRAIVEALD